MELDLIELIKDKRILVSVSGGVDSMVLLHKLTELNVCKISVFHFNHETRGNENIKDLELVKEYCDTNGIELFERTESMREYAHKNKMSEEEAGRLLRKRYIDEISDNFDFIATGHNLDDQVETVLMRIIRGTGINGLSGIKIIDGKYIRPLLTLSKNKIREYAKEKGVPFREDHTNFENDYTRNSIRNELIPFIKEKYNPNLNESILKLSEISKEYENIKNIWIAAISKNIERKKTFSKIILKDFESISNFEKIEVIKSEISRIRGSIYNFESSHFEEILKILSSKNSASVIINGMIFYRYSEYFCIRKYDEIKNKLEISKKGKYYFNNFEIEVDSNEEISLRTRKNGDKLIYNNREIKLKDFFIDKKLDIYLRDRIPLVIVKEKIVQVGDLYGEKIKIRRNDE